MPRTPSTMRHLTTRLPIDMVERIDLLAARASNLVAGTNVKRSAVIIQSLERGLASLERDIAKREAK